MVRAEHPFIPVLAVAALGALGCSVNVDDEGAALPLLEEHAQAVQQSLRREPRVEASYTYPLPEGWFAESYAAPQPWFPEFPWSGTETVHFLPGFPDATSPDWWSYNYLIWVESGPPISAAKLTSAFIGYYKGLVGCGTQLPCDPERFDGQLRRAVRLGDLELFVGHVDSYDFSPEPVPITLNLLVTSVVCPKSKHRALLVSASPQPLSDETWRQLLAGQIQFRCR